MRHTNIIIAAIIALTPMAMANAQTSRSAQAAPAPKTIAPKASPQKANPIPAPAPSPAPPIAQALTPTPLPQYGRTITLSEAKIVAAAAEAEARKNNWSLVITIVEPNGAIVLSQKMDGAQYGSIDVANKKAITAAHFRRPTSLFQEAVKTGNLNSVFSGAMAIEGGEPIIKNGAIIGAIGVSGATAAQDGIAAKAGAAAVP